MKSINRIVIWATCLFCCNILMAQTPVAYYPFNGNANDATGTLNGTVHGAALTTDRFGNANSAYSFDGVDDAISFAGLPMTNTDNFTLMAWVNPALFDPANQFNKMIVSLGPGENGYNMGMGNSNGSGGGNQLGGLYNLVSWLPSGAFFSTINTWYHVAMVRENGITKFYLNGVLAPNTFNAGPKAFVTAFQIGGQDFDPTHYWNGKIDEVKIYNEGLTALQVQQEYASSSQLQKPGSGNAISFDGVDDNFSVSTQGYTNIQTYTIECWLKKNSANLNAHIWESIGLSAPSLESDGTNALNYFVGSSNLISTGELAVGKWYHIACVYDKLHTLQQLYVNGILVGSNTVNVSDVLGNNIGFGERLFGTPSNRFFNGELDEVRIWNIALTETQIRDRMCHKITSGDPLFSNLAAYYNFDESSGNIVFDGTVNGNNGSLVNNPTRLTSGAPIGNTSTYSYAGASSTAQLTHPTRGDKFTATLSVGDADGLQIYCVTEDPNNTNGQTVLSNNNSYFGVFAINGINVPFTTVYHYDAIELNGNPQNRLMLYQRADNAAASWLRTSALLDSNAHILASTSSSTEYMVGLNNIQAAYKPGSGNAISFDGFDDGVEVTNSATLQFPGDLSVECWVKIPETQNNIANIDNAIIEKWGGSNSGIGYPFVIRYKKNDKTAQWIRYNGSDSKGIDGITVVGDNKWHHLAATKSGALLSFYVDGIIQGTTTDFADLTNVNNTQNLNIGTRGPIALGPNNLTGLIDEVRIWNIGLTQAQIRDRMCKKITNADTLFSNLAAYYNFDETDGNTVFDATVNGNNGTLANNPTRLTSGAAIGNASSHDYTNTIKSASITLPNGESIAITSTTGNPDGVQIYSVNEQPNTLNGINTIGSTDVYFGVFQVNGNSPQYTAVYNYLGNPAVTALNEANLQLYNRADNAATSWTPLAAVPNTSAKTITVSGEHTEYLLGKTDIALPLTLLAFTAAKQNNSVQLNWTTRNEINTASFVVERSNGNNNFSAIGQVKASGRMSGDLYQLADAAPFNTGATQYYRLKMIDNDGRWVYSNIIKINSNTQTIVSVYPNPASAVITINSHKNQQGIITNASGQTMCTITLINGSQTLHIAQWPAGLYLLKTQDQVIKIIKNQ